MRIEDRLTLSVRVPVSLVASIDDIAKARGISRNLVILRALEICLEESVLLRDIKMPSK